MAIVLVRRVNFGYGGEFFFRSSHALGSAVVAGKGTKYSTHASFLYFPSCKPVLNNLRM